MKKIITALVLSSIAITPVMAEELISTPQTPAVYELGKYNFTFEQKKENIVPAKTEIKVQETTPATTKINVQKDILKPVTSEIKTPSPDINPVNTKINTQKEIIKQIKNDEVVKNIKKDAAEAKNVTEQQIEKVYEQVDVTKNKTEKEIINNIQKTEQKIDKTKTNAEKTINKEIRQTQQTIDKKKNKVKPNKKSQFSTKQEKPVKYDPDKPPFKFQIKEIQYKGSTTKSIIESL